MAAPATPSSEWRFYLSQDVDLQVRPPAACSRTVTALERSAALCRRAQASSTRVHALPPYARYVCASAVSLGCCHTLDVATTTLEAHGRVQPVLRHASSLAAKFSGWRRAPRMQRWHLRALCGPSGSHFASRRAKPPTKSFWAAAPLACYPAHPEHHNSYTTALQQCAGHYSRCCCCCCTSSAPVRLPSCSIVIFPLMRISACH